MNIMLKLQYTFARLRKGISKNEYLSESGNSDCNASHYNNRKYEITLTQNSDLCVMNAFINKSSKDQTF